MFAMSQERSTRLCAHIYIYITRIPLACYCTLYAVYILMYIDCAYHWKNICIHKISFRRISHNSLRRSSSIGVDFFGEWWFEKKKVRKIWRKAPSYFLIRFSRLYLRWWKSLLRQSLDDEAFFVIFLWSNRKRTIFESSAVSSLCSFLSRRF